MDRSGTLRLRLAFARGRPRGCGPGRRRGARPGSARGSRRSRLRQRSHGARQRWGRRSELARRCRRKGGCSVSPAARRRRSRRARRCSSSRGRSGKRRRRRLGGCVGSRGSVRGGVPRGSRFQGSRGSRHFRLGLPLLSRLEHFHREGECALLGRLEGPDAHHLSSDLLAATVADRQYDGVLPGRTVRRMAQCALDTQGRERRLPLHGGRIEAQVVIAPRTDGCAIEDRRLAVGAAARLAGCREASRVHEAT